MALPPISPIGASNLAGAARAAEAPAAAGFGDALARGLSGVSQLERGADAVGQSLASGGTAQVTDLMVANTKSSLAVDTLVAVRNRAVEAYQEVMRLQV